MITFTVLLAFYVVMAISEILAIEPPEGNKQLVAVLGESGSRSGSAGEGAKGFFFSLANSSYGEEGVLGWGDIHIHSIYMHLSV